MKYILKGKVPVMTEDTTEWGEFMVTEDVRVGYDEGNGLKVSTVFLGLDHNHHGGLPILFETMVFEEGDWLDLDQERYHTWEEAEAGHKKFVEKYL